MHRLLPFVALLTAGCPASPDPSPLVNGQVIDAAAMRQAMEDFADGARLPGLATCVFTVEATNWCDGVGLLDPTRDALVDADSAFLIASVSKMVTAAAALAAVEEGVLELSAAVSQHADFVLEHPSNNAITTRQLLQHTGAIADSAAMDNYYTYGADPEISLDEAVRRYFDPSGADYNADTNFLDQTPGEAFAYSNMGSALAGWVVERATDTDFDAWTAQKLFTPLSLTNTSWWLSDFNEETLAMPSEWVNGTWEPYGQYSFSDYPNGGLRTSANDLARFGRMLLRDGELDGVRVLTAPSLQEMTMADLDDGEGGGVGLGWFTSSELPQGWGGHDGGEAGALSALYLHRAQGVGVLYLANGDGEDDDARTAFEATLLATAEALAK